MKAKAQSLDQLIKTISTVIMIEISIFLTKKTNTEIMSAISNLATTIGNLFELAYLYKMYKKLLPEIKSDIVRKECSEGNRIYVIIKKILIIAIPLSLTALITTISKNIDSTAIVNDLKNIIGYEEAKRQYGILSGKVDALINFPLSFNMAIVTSLLPSIASTNGKLKNKEKRINQSFLLGMIITIPVTLIFCFFSDEILKLLFPNASNGGKILAVSSISVIFITIEQITNIILNGIGKNIVPIKAIATGVIVKAILNRLLVPRVELIIGGTIGASIATLTCHIVESTFSMVELIKHSKIKISILNILKPLCASLIMIIISKVLFIKCENIVDFRINLISSLIIGGVIYLLFAKKMLKIDFFKIKKNGYSQ